MKLIYFAWIKSQIGISEEDVDPPESVTTVGELLTWLAERGPQFAAALQDRDVIRVAINQEFADTNATIAPGDEVALFPPVTGG